MVIQIQNLKDLMEIQVLLQVQETINKCHHCQKLEDMLYQIMRVELRLYLIMQEGYQNLKKFK